MKKFLIGFVLAGGLSLANAATNLAIVNPDVTAEGKLVSATGTAQVGQIYKVPTGNDLVRADPARSTWNTAKWKKFSAMAAGEEYEVCKTDIPVNSNVAGDALCKEWTYLPKVAGPSVNTTGVVEVTWSVPDSNTDGSTPAYVGSYKLYQGASEASLAALALSLPVGTNKATVNLPVGTWYFALSSVSPLGVEGPRGNSASVIVAKTIVPGPPTSLKLTVTISAPQ